MVTSIRPESISSLQNFVRVGHVTTVVDAERILVTVVDNGLKIEVWCSFAMGNMPLPSIEDKALVAGETLESGFIIGLFPSESSKTQSFTLEQDLKNGRTTLTVPEGDLELRSDKGCINLQAASGISLNSPQFALDAARGDIKMTEMNYQGLKLGATVERTKLFLGKLNSTIGRLVEKAKNVYRQVDNLNQVKAGRMRTLVDGSYHLKGERIIEKAEKEVSIDGEKINLG